MSFFRATARLLKNILILLSKPELTLPSVWKKCENMVLGSWLYVLVVICNHGGWICGLIVREARLWAFCSRRGGADEWRVRFLHHETLNGLVMVPVQCSSFPTGRLSDPPGIPSSGLAVLQTAAVDVRKSGEKLHIHPAAVGGMGEKSGRDRKSDDWCSLWELRAAALLLLLLLHSRVPALVV